jgi:hypothetical protein
VLENERKRARGDRAQTNNKDLAREFNFSHYGHFSHNGYAHNCCLEISAFTVKVGSVDAVTHQEVSQGY